MICPMCETESPDDLPECTGCGKLLVAQAAPNPFVAPLVGLEETLLPPGESAVGPVLALLDLERTAIARKDLRIALEPMMLVERTQIESDPDAQLFWGGAGPDLDLGREKDDGERTAAPVDTGLCPWCGAAATGAVCDACGRRRLRYTSANAAKAPPAQSGELVTCPACFSRVANGPRCENCHVPFAPREVR